MHIYQIAATFLVCLIAPAYLGSPCPPSSQILPCKCAKRGQDTIVNCAYHDPELLKMAFSSLSSERMIIDFLNVSSTRLNVIGPNFFQNITVRSTMLYGDRWSSIDDKAFINQDKSLERLIIKESLLTSVPIKSMKILTGLEYFAMINSEVAEIEKSAFDSMQSANTLRTLDLSSNYIRTIGDGAFAKLTTLEHLVLYNNKITELKSGVLPPTNLIKLLNMGHNRLESVPGDISELSNQGTVYLNHNSIELLSGVDLSAMVKKNLFVSLYENPLKCTCAMRILALTKVDHVSGNCTKAGVVKSLSSLQPSDFKDCFLNLRKKFLAKE